MNSHGLKIPRSKQKNKQFDDINRIIPILLLMDNDLVDVKVNLSTIVDIVISLIKNAQQFSKLSGVKKKEMVISALHFLIKKIPDVDGTPGIIEMMLVAVIPSIIDWTIIVNKEGLELNSVVNCGCWPKVRK
jgi:hypothetical protein